MHSWTKLIVNWSLTYSKEVRENAIMLFLRKWEVDVLRQCYGKSFPVAFLAGSNHQATILQQYCNNTVTILQQYCNNTVTIM